MAAFVPAIIGGVSSLISGFTGSSAAKKAAAQQRAAANQAAAGLTVAGQKAQDIQNQAFQGSMANVQPIYNTANDANQALASALGLGGGAYGTAEGVPLGALTKPVPLNLPGALNLQGFNPTQADIQLDPGFQFRLDQAQKMIENSAAAKGAVLGSGTLKALDEYSQGLASSEYSNAWNRALQKYNTDVGAQTTNYNAAVQAALDEFNAGNINQSQLFQRLSSFASGALPAAQTLVGIQSGYADKSGNIGMGTAANIGNLITGAGNAQAAGTIGSNNAWQNALGQISNIGQRVSLAQLLNQPGAVPQVPNEPIYVPSNMTNYQYSPTYVPPLNP